MRQRSPASTIVAPRLAIKHHITVNIFGISLLNRSAASMSVPMLSAAGAILYLLRRLPADFAYLAARQTEARQYRVMPHF